MIFVGFTIEFFTLPPRRGERKRRRKKMGTTKTAGHSVALQKKKKAIAYKSNCNSSEFVGFSHVIKWTKILIDI